MLQLINAAGRPSMVCFAALFRRREEGQRIAIGDAHTIEEHGGTVAPLWKRPLGWFKQSLAADTIPESAPIIPLGSIHADQEWHWTEDCAISAGSHFHSERAYAVIEGQDVSAVLIVRDRTPIILSPREAEKWIKDGPPKLYSIDHELFSVLDPGENGVVARIPLHVEHGSEIESSWAEEIAKNAMSWLYPNALGPKPASFNPFAEAFGFFSLEDSRSRRFWYRPDLGVQREDQMTLIISGLPGALKLMHRLAPPGLTVVSERLVTTALPGGGSRAVALLDPPVAQKDQNKVPAVAELTPEQTRHLRAGAPIDEWFALIKHQTTCGAFAT
jgi:hypothetical protein